MFVSFNKRYINIGVIKSYLENNGDLVRLFNTDALIFQDNISAIVYKWYSEEVITNEQLKLKIENYENNFKQKN